MEPWKRGHLLLLACLVAERMRHGALLFAVLRELPPVGRHWAVVL
jgi:hypothetical protein